MTLPPLFPCHGACSHRHGSQSNVHSCPLLVGLRFHSVATTKELESRCQGYRARGYLTGPSRWPPRPLPREQSAKFAQLLFSRLSPKPRAANEDVWKGGKNGHQDHIHTREGSPALLMPAGAPAAFVLALLSPVAAATPWASAHSPKNCWIPKEKLDYEKSPSLISHRLCLQVPNLSSA